MSKKEIRFVILLMSKKEIRLVIHSDGRRPIDYLTIPDAAMEPESNRYLTLTILVGGSAISLAYRSINTSKLDTNISFALRSGAAHHDENSSFKESFQ